MIEALAPEDIGSMSLHRLSGSKDLIAAIGRLGKVLGYHVAHEHPLVANAEAEPPAADVAWLGSDDDRFPLMLFEIESVASNAMANNALKVFGQDSSVFEKPLFFFHVIATGGLRSTRPETLERMFGTYNYRVYRLADGDGTQLVQDVLSQHRRIRSSLDFAAFYKACDHGDWGGCVDTLSALRFARSLGFSRADYIPALIHIARTCRHILDEIRVTIEDPKLVDWFHDAHFESYIGSRFFDGLLFALLLGRAESPEDAARWNERLEQWQSGIDGMTMLGPYLGLDHSYDEFLLGGAGALVALLVATSRRSGSCCETLCRALGRISSQIGAQWAGSNLHVWTCHVATALNLEDVFAIARAHLQELGGVPRDFMVSPRPIASGEERLVLEIPDRASVPEMNEFRKLCESAHSHSPDTQVDVDEVALHALDVNDFVVHWSQPILSCLWDRVRSDRRRDRLVPR